VKADLGASEERAREQLAKKEAELKRLELGAEVRKTKHHETMRLLGDKKKVRRYGITRSGSSVFWRDSLPILSSKIVSVLRVRDACLGSRIRIFSIPFPGSTSRI
jgi:hypothetical protein